MTSLFCVEMSCYGVKMKSCYGVKRSLPTSLQVQYSLQTIFYFTEAVSKAKIH